MKQSNFYGFTVHNWKAELAGFPKEDSYAFDEDKKIVCVADGVTRDFTDGNVVTRDLEGLLKSWNGKYPKYAQDVSKICTDNFLKTKSLIKANKSIGDYNAMTLDKIDYLGNDFAGCTAAGVFEKGEFLYWQFIADSGIAIIDSFGNLKFKTPDEGPHCKEKNPYLERILKQHGEFQNPEGRKIIRSQYRNNPEEKFAYGVLTGEKTAENYIKGGKEKLNTGDYVLLYTDGVGEFIFNNEKIDREFRNKLLQNDFKGMREFCKKKISNEGTLVVYQKPARHSSPSAYSMMMRQKELCERDFFGPLY
ncbi:MAG: hypothetical protein PHQ66_01710 [Candidatus Nanoarchaeia archaeon]|nr:hypothetical protein [Candidatus Nanoarchaeia archaeon]MDD5357910.1 hypothetical protein [Candidatus Nanoarchaeia archaeon]MDD5588829.1 hypothetical protein [Candidatus Nanoarchaeia archaeon]